MSDETATSSDAVDGVSPTADSAKHGDLTNSPMVFISHDSRDADFAEAFSHLLTDASGGIVKSFRSSDRKGTSGIEFGDEWYRAIMRRLEGATDVVALLTSRSIDRPWILYEAGVAKGKLGSTVFGLALGVPLTDAVSGPFAQFQNSADDEDSITKMVLQLISRHPEAAPREEAVRRQVQAFRETLESLLRHREGSDERDDPVAEDSNSSDAPVARLFEEVKLLVRDMPERLALEVSNQAPLGTREPLSSMMVEDMMTWPLRGGPPQQWGVSAGLLVCASLLSPYCPPLQGLTENLVESMESGVRARAERSRRRLVEVLEFSCDGPWMESLYPSRREFEAVDVFRRLLSNDDWFDEALVNSSRG